MSKGKKAERNARKQTVILQDDRPLIDAHYDWLGLDQVAAHLATVLNQRSLVTGFILGVEGPWGSGKSTLISLTQKKLSEISSPPRTIAFNPWLIGDRDSLLVSLFADIANAIERTDDPCEGVAEKVAESAAGVAKQVRSYAAHLTALTKVLELAGTFLPGASPVGRGLAWAIEATSKFTEAAEALPSDQPLGKQKEALEAALATLPEPIIIFVDDLERLEPSETIEMIRLIRAVGDLPNLIYVLCYDREVLVGNIEHALAIKDGARYLEKVVQVSLPIPQPEPFALRRWFLEECMQLSGLIKDYRAHGDAIRRLARVVDGEGGRRLQTPRDVIRVLNAIKLYWAPIRDYVDFADLVWLQLVRIKDPRLYGWVENYIGDFAAIVLEDAGISRPKKTMRKLRKILSDNPESFTRAVYDLKSLLPGISVGRDEDKKPVAQGFKLDREEVRQFTRSRRLGSPHYHRYYFSFGPATGDIHEADAQFISAWLTTSPKTFAARMMELAQTKGPSGSVLLSSMLDRLSAYELPETHAETILASLADCMDVAYEHDRDGFGTKRSWEAGERMWTTALLAIPAARRNDVLYHLIDKGSALGWLAHCLRHANYNDASQLHPILTPETIRTASERYIARIRSEPHAVMSSARLAGIFYLWSDIEGTEAAKAVLQIWTEPDEALIRFLHSARSWIGSDRIYRPLRPRELDPFLEFGVARRRTDEMARLIEKYPHDVRRLIADVISGFEDGDLQSRH